MAFSDRMVPFSVLALKLARTRFAVAGDEDAMGALAARAQLHNSKGSSTMTSSRLEGPGQLTAFLM